MKRPQPLPDGPLSVADWQAWFQSARDWHDYAEHLERRLAQLEGGLKIAGPPRVLDGDKAMREWAKAQVKRCFGPVSLIVSGFVWECSYFPLDIPEEDIAAAILAVHPRRILPGCSVRIRVPQPFNAVRSFTARFKPVAVFTATASHPIEEKVKSF